MQPPEARREPSTGGPAAARAQPGYVAFISYAREDEAFAKQLETEIEAQPRPGGQGAMRVFRDRSDFTGNAYEAALEGHLRDSAALIVLCSPHARRSSFVGDEIERFARLAGPTRIFPILVSGLPDNEADDLKAFPPALVKVTRELGMPLGAEYRGIDLKRERLNRGRFESEWYKLLGNLFDQPAAQIREHDQQRLLAAQHRRLATSAGAVVLLVALAAAMGWLWRRAAVAEERASDMSAKTQTLLAELERERAGGADGAAGPTSAQGPQAAPPAASPAAPPGAPLPASTPASAPPSTPSPAAPAPTPPVPSQPAPGPSTSASPTPAPTAPPTARPAPVLQPRVYFHIVVEAQRRPAQALQAALERAGLGVVVPGIQQLDVGPTKSSELRYFHDAERDEAERIGQVLRTAGAADLTVKKVPGYENSTKIRARHYELWLRPGG